MISSTLARRRTPGWPPKVFMCLGVVLLIPRERLVDLALYRRAASGK